MAHDTFAFPAEAVPGAPYPVSVEELLSGFAYALANLFAGPPLPKP